MIHFIRHIVSNAGPRRASSACRSSGPRKRSGADCRLESLESRQLLSADMVVTWNEVLLDAIRVDRTAPPVASRSMAIVHIAIFDAVNAIERTYEPYLFRGHAPPGTSAESAVAAAAHRTLVELYPSQVATFDAALDASLADIPNGPGENKGLAIGRASAKHILSARRHDGWDQTVSYTAGVDPGDWQPTPPGFLSALLPQWPQVTPFSITSGSQFRPAGPPALTSDSYAMNYNEVKSLGAKFGSTRTPEQTEIALFWADGPGTATPPGHWNVIAQDLAVSHSTSLIESARLFALLNIAEADAGIASWDAKYEYNFWRPVTGIREGERDGNVDTEADPSWTPLITTPPFPSYTSGHSTFSGAAATILASFFGTDSMNFYTSSDGMPGVTRSFTRLSDAAAEAGRSRIYGGIHWNFDNLDALAAGQALADHAFQNLLTPIQSHVTPKMVPQPVKQSRRHHSAHTLLKEALARWDQASIAAPKFGTIDVRIGDLPGSMLGQVVHNTIWLDSNAAGWGWYVDATPRSDSEFVLPGDQGEEGRVDLLTVIAHELGHLGIDHSDSGVMSDTLDTAVRQVPTVRHSPIEPVDQILALDWDLLRARRREAWTSHGSVV